MEKLKEISLLKAMLCIAAKEIYEKEKKQDLSKDSENEELDKIILKWQDSAKKKYKDIKEKYINQHIKDSIDIDYVYENMITGDRINLSNGVEIIRVPGGWIRIVNLPSTCICS